VRREHQERNGRAYHRHSRKRSLPSSLIFFSFKLSTFFLLLLVASSNPTPPLLSLRRSHSQNSHLISPQTLSQIMHLLRKESLLCVPIYLKSMKTATTKTHQAMVSIFSLYLLFSHTLIKSSVRRGTFRLLDHHPGCRPVLKKTRQERDKHRTKPKKIRAPPSDPSCKDERLFADFEETRRGLRILRRRDEVCGFWEDETRFADFEKTRRGLGVFRRRGFLGTNSVSATKLLLRVRQIFVCPDELWLVTMAARKSRRILWICFRAWLRDEISVPMQTNSYYCDAIVVMRCSYLSFVPSIPKAVSLLCKSLLLTISDWGSCKRMRPAAVGDHRQLLATTSLLKFFWRFVLNWSWIFFTLLRWFKSKFAVTIITLEK